jgi:hypothetical protein
LLRRHTGRGLALAPLDTTAARLPYAPAIGLATVTAQFGPITDL